MNDAPRTPRVDWTESLLCISAEEHRRMTLGQSRPKERLRVIAGTYGQFRSYLAARDLRPCRAEYIGSDHRLMGISIGSEVIVTGTACNRRDWQQLKDLLNVSLAKITHDPI